MIAVEVAVDGTRRSQAEAVAHTNLGNCNLGTEMMEGTCDTAVDRTDDADTGVLLDYLADQQYQSFAFSSVRHTIANIRVLGNS